MTETDNSLKYNRTKQIAYWQLTALNNIHSLSQTVLHYPYFQLHNERDYDWRNMYFLKKVYIKGKQIRDTFISQSAKYLGDEATFDRISLYKSQLYQAEIAKHEFWTKVYNLKPITKEGYESKKKVRLVVWRERFIPYTMVIIFATIINAVSGIAKLKLSKRLLTFAMLSISAQLIVRVRQSSNIFYGIPELPDPELQSERQKIIRQSLVIDGKINSYDLNENTTEMLEEIANKQTKQEKKDILEVLGYNVITLQNQQKKSNSAV